MSFQWLLAPPLRRTRERPEEQEQELEDETGGRELAKTRCADKSRWKNRAGRNCKWFAANDNGCTKYKDYGQRTNCKKTCNKCPQVYRQNSNSNPWHTAVYKYMPSAADLAKCAKRADGSMNGCNGGNLGAVWDNNLRTLSRNVWVMGEKCMPYDMKCKKASGVVNPLSGGQCSKYASYQKWHKPCNCISSQDKTNRFSCPRYRPSGGCGFDVPYAFFQVNGVNQGLSIANAVKNFQRQIAEAGPLYISFATTNGFMKNDWKKYPIYTGGGTADGGHAVTVVGWGKGASGGWSHDYWLLRNSWGADWADKGYCKFKRGVNLDGIEGAAGASMATSTFKDWSPPYCSYNGYSSSYYSDASMYKLFLKITCSKNAKLKIFTSQKLSGGKASAQRQVARGVSGRNLNLNVKANSKTTTTAIDAKNLGFGKRQGEMWIKIVADDGKGNTANTDHYITVPTVTR